MAIDSRRVFVLACCLAGVCTLRAEARPSHRKALADFIGAGFATRLNDCRTCHQPQSSEEAVESLELGVKPHNAFGRRLKVLRRERKEAGAPTDLIARLEAIANEDSDADGAPNLLELLTGHNPGEAEDVPTAAELVEGNRKVGAFLARPRGYAWRPLERVERPALPAVRDSNAIHNPIDLFVMAQLEGQGIAPNPEARKATLLRRVTIDLTGLPPSAHELHFFLKDNREDAYERLVDRLLDSPQYGERWGRHFLDVWRYSDWAGYGTQVRDSQPHIWRWRDWVVDSLNANVGYDQMVLAMLAGDELAPESTDALRATGFLVRNYKLLSRERWLQETVDHASQAFLGLTLGCARCHDHMYDPIRQRDYYEFRAIFEPHKVRIDRLPGEADTNKVGLARAFDADLEAKTFVFERGDERAPGKAPVAPNVPEALGGHYAISEVTLPPFAVAPHKRPFVVAEDLAASDRTRARALESGRLNIAKALLSLPAHLGDSKWLEVAMAGDAILFADLDAKIAVERHNALDLVIRAESLEDDGRKDSDEWKDIATRAGRSQRNLTVLEARRNWLASRKELLNANDTAVTLKKLDEQEKALAGAIERASMPDSTEYSKRPSGNYPAASTGRRLALARWLVDRENPLAARVAVNHLWLRHFSRGLVPTPAEFGRNGQAPSHPALLDWLAAEFMDNGWDMKAMHRLMVTSATYRRDSTPNPSASSRDPDNLLLWRMGPRRLEAEAVRDTLLFVSGRLHLTLGGPDLPHGQGLTVPRRSLYFQHAAEKSMEFLQLFDAPSVTECYRRTESIQPQQALALFNSDLARQAAMGLTERLAGLEDDSFIIAAFEHVLSRRPNDDETRLCRDHLAGAPGKRRESLVHVLLNHHEFMTIR